MTRNSKLSIILSLVLITIAIGTPVYGQEEHPKVETTSGVVVGRTDGELQTFFGIPYAEPPVGERRFLPPGPPPTWSTELDASEMGPACPNPDTGDEFWTFAEWSEDCLTLNVWTPDAFSGSRPVMVWIHGGAFTTGTTNYEIYSGANLARRGDIVVFSLQYRLGAFGYLDVSEFGGEAYKSSANNGLLDQIAALKWIQVNAAAFGGDPNNITIVGWSAGGISVGAIMSSAMADGLYHRAVLQSAHPSVVTTPEFSRHVARSIAEKAGVSTLEELQNLPAQQLLDAQVAYDSDTNVNLGLISFTPLLDGVVIEKPLVNAISDGSRTPVPILIGSNLDEFRYWIRGIDGLDRMPFDFYRPWLDAVTDGNGDALIETYQQAKPTYSDPEIGIALVGDAGFRMPSIRLAEATSNQGQSAWMYLFTLQSTIDGGRFGSPHAAEMPFVFNNLEAPQAGGTLDYSANPEGYQKLADDMQDAWISFIRSGDPSTSGLGEWPTYNSDSRSTMIIDFESRVEDDPYSAERMAWDGVPFDGITPPPDQSNPGSYGGTQITPAIIIAVLGPTRVAGIVIGLIVVIAGIGFGIHWWRRRRQSS